MSSLKGRVAIVTGAAKGIGAAIAHELARQGAKVAVNYLTSEADADEVVRRIATAGGESFAVRADVTDSAQIEALFRATRDRYGRVDILVNNAGPLELASLEEMTPRHVDDQVRLIFTSVVLGTRAAAAHFEEPGGVVINISSETARNIVPGTAVCAAMKSAVEVFTRNVAQELGPRNIRVVAVAPGFTVTPATHWMSAGMIEGIVARTALRRPGESDDIAPVVAFLASDAGAWITGTTLSASGGMVL